MLSDNFGLFYFDVLRLFLDALDLWARSFDFWVTGVSSLPPPPPPSIFFSLGGNKFSLFAWMSRSWVSGGMPALWRRVERAVVEVVVGAGKIWWGVGRGWMGCGPAPPLPPASLHSLGCLWAAEDI